MWHSDKPLIQHEVAQNLSSLIHCFSDTNDAALFVDAFLWTMQNEWPKIDKYRLDKFMSLYRYFIRDTFKYLINNGWEVCFPKSTTFSTFIISLTVSNPNNIFLQIDLVKRIAASLKICFSADKTVTGYAMNPGVALHVIDIFLVELAKAFELSNCEDKVQQSSHVCFSKIMETNSHHNLQTVCE